MQMLERLPPDLEWSQVRRVEFFIPDYALVEMEPADLTAYLLSVRALVDQAVRAGLTVKQYRDHESMCEVYAVVLEGR